MINLKQYNFNFNRYFLYLNNDLFYFLCLILICPFALIFPKFVFGFSILLGIHYIARYRHIRKSLRYFAPFILTITIYTLYTIYIKELTVGVDNALWDLRVQYGIFSYNVDRFIFVDLLGISMPSFWIYQGNNISMFTLFFSIIYLLQPIFFLSFLGIKIMSSIKNGSYNQIELLSVASLLTLIVVILIFALFPTPPPWYVFQYGIGTSNLGAINHSLAAGGIFDLQLFSFNASMLLWKSSSIKFGSFPSVHVFTASYLFLFNKSQQNKSRYLFSFLMLSNMGAVVYLGHHFLTDAIFGFLLAYTINKISMKIIEIQTE